MNSFALSLALSSHCLLSLSLVCLRLAVIKMNFSIQLNWNVKMLINLSIRWEPSTCPRTVPKKSIRERGPEHYESYQLILHAPIELIILINQARCAALRLNECEKQWEKRGKFKNICSVDPRAGRLIYQCGDGDDIANILFFFCNAK